MNSLLAWTSLKLNRLSKGSQHTRLRLCLREHFTDYSNSWLRPGITAELAPMKSCKKLYRAVEHGHSEEHSSATMSPMERLLNCLECFCLEM